MPVSKDMVETGDGYPIDIEWALRSAYKLYGSSIAAPTAFNVMRRAASHVLKNRTPCKHVDFGLYTLEQIICYQESDRYIIEDINVAIALTLLKEEMRTNDPT